MTASPTSPERRDDDWRRKAAEALRAREAERAAERRARLAAYGAPRPAGAPDPLPHQREADRFAAQERALAADVRAHRREKMPSLPGPYTDVGPKAFGRGAVEVATVESVDVDSRGRPRVTSARVVRRKGPKALSCIPEETREACRMAADRYAATVELVVSVRGPGDGPRGGTSDGGAAVRCEWAAQRRDLEDVIGRDLVLQPDGLRAHADRGRRALRALDVVNAAVLDGLTVTEILFRWGWSRGPSNDKAVRAALRDRLEALARYMGLLTEGDLTARCK